MASKKDCYLIRNLTLFQIVCRRTMERIQVLYYLAKALSVAVFLRWKNTIFGIHPSLEIVWQKALDVEWAGLPGHSGFS